MTAETALRLQEIIDDLQSDSEAQVVVFKSDVPDFFLTTSTWPPSATCPHRQRASCRSDRSGDPPIEGPLHHDRIGRWAHPGRRQRAGPGPRPAVREPRESAYFGQPEVGIGILPGGGTERLPRLLGRDCALEAIRTSSDYGAAQAERWGWVTRALPDDQLDAFVDDMVAGWPSRTPRPSPRPRPPSIDNLLRAQDTVTAVVSRWIAAAGDPDYRDAFLTILKDPMIGHRDLINVRSRGAQGNATASRTCDVCRYGVGCGFGLPIDLDPTILSTGLAGLNPIRDIANVRTTVLLAEANSTSTTPSGWRAPAPTSPGGILNIGGNGGLITTQRVQTATTAVTVLADITPSSNPSRQPGSCERHLGDARERHRRVLPLRGVGQYERASDLLARSQRSAARHAGFGVVNDADEPHDHESATSDLG